MHDAKQLDAWRFSFCPGPPDYKVDWEGLHETFEWVQALKDVPQSPLYHAEGDVWIHTRMVLEALAALPEFQGLEEPWRSVVFLATLMHDIGKPLRTRIESDGSIISPGHAGVGERMARALLWEGIPEPVPFMLREQIAQLVRHHALPLWALEKADSRPAVLQASQGCRLDFLALLAEADVRGRIAPDQQGLLDRVDLFREYAKEMHCYADPYHFVNGLARYTYFRKGEGAPDYVPFDDHLLKVYMLSGLPGAGKDTWIHTDGPGLPVVSLDDIRIRLGIPPDAAQGKVVQTAKELAREYLRARQDFIWNATNITRTMRAQLSALFLPYKARVHLVYIESGFRETFFQNRNRGDKVPLKAMKRMIQKWEVPDVTEAPVVQYVIRGASGAG